LLAATLLPYLMGMSGWLYLVAALALGLRFCWFGWKLWRDYSDALAKQTFWFSIWYLALLFGALLVDHYAGPYLYAP
jgi:protoheme IX farnesyltransferase